MSRRTAAWSSGVARPKHRASAARASSDGSGSSGPLSATWAA